MKPFHSYDQQIDLLESRGLQIPDRDTARHFLQHHNYYRLSAYRFSFQDASDHFRPGANFEDLCQLYQFDRGLRLLVGEACEALEVSVRARWAYVLGEQHGSQAFENPSIFGDPQLHTRHLASLDREIGRSHEVFIPHYQNTYGMPRPPIWAACEVMSFGLLSRFYANIKQVSLQKQIAKTYGLSAQGLESLLLHASYLRNLCAHHSRLWNRSFTITVALPRRHPVGVVPALNSDPTADRKIYNSLVLLAHLMDVISATADWKPRLKAHLLTLNQPDHTEMAFPSGWQALDFWQM